MKLIITAFKYLSNRQTIHFCKIKVPGDSLISMVSINNLLLYTEPARSICQKINHSNITIRKTLSFLNSPVTSYFKKK
jgi:hypothetical protein